MSEVNLKSTIITLSAIVAGVVCLALGHKTEGGYLFTFAAGVAMFKPVKEGI
jgi:hypothetical protein